MSKFIQIHFSNHIGGILHSSSSTTIHIRNSQIDVEVYHCDLQKRKYTTVGDELNFSTSRDFRDKVLSPMSGSF